MSRAFFMEPRDINPRSISDGNPPKSGNPRDARDKLRDNLAKAAAEATPADGDRAGAEDQPRPEETIVAVYRMLREARARGEEPTRVVMDRETYERLQAYRARLGEAPDGKPDYLERYSIFGLEIFVESDAILEVC